MSFVLCRIRDKAIIKGCLSSLKEGYLENTAIKLDAHVGYKNISPMRIKVNRDIYCDWKLKDEL